MLQTKYLIIGASAAGVTAANYLAKIDSQAQITCVTAEDAKPYNKCWLVDYLAGEKQASQINLVLNAQVNLLSNTKVVAIDPVLQIADLAQGGQIHYQKLLLAIGVQPFVPDILGATTAQHVFTFHDLLDTQKLIQFIAQNQPKKAVVIGGGLTGIECADALWQLGLQVSIVERSGQILGKMIDQCGAGFLTTKMQDLGVKLYLNSQVQAIADHSVTLASGQHLPADLVILAAGVRPNKIQVLPYHANHLNYVGHYIAPDAYLQTNLPNIWAAGDIIMLPDLLTGELAPSCSWPDAVLQGRMAAQNMFGQDQVRHTGLLSTANSHFFGIDFISFGNLNSSFSQGKQQANSYQNISLDQNGQVQGALLMGDTSPYLAVKRAVMAKQPYLV
jgi:nitrite reductase (NADH) large subunit